MFKVGRRDLLLSAGALLLSPVVRAQQVARPVIGFLNGSSYESSANLVRSFHQGLGEAGYAEGRNVSFEYRSADGKYDRLPGLADDLARRKVSVIAATGTPTGLPAKAATTTIPIVFVTGSDPVEQGLVTSLSRPGGNLTGVTTLAVQLGRKRLELMHELVPNVKVMAVLVNPTGPNLDAVTRDLLAAAGALGVAIHFLNASTEADFDTAFAALHEMKAGALVIGTDTFFNSENAKLGALTARHKVPAIYQYREFAAGGGLMSYAGNISEAYRLAGVYTGRILKGEKPSDLPVQQSIQAELFINLGTAKALGITFPQATLIRADEMIQ